MRQEEAHRHRHDQEINQAGTDQEQDRGCDQKRQKRTALMFVKPRRHKHVDLAGNHRKRQKQALRNRASFSWVKNHSCGAVKIIFTASGSGAAPKIRHRQDVVDIGREIEADTNITKNCSDRPHQPLAQFDQMFDQGRL